MENRVVNVTAWLLLSWLSAAPSQPARAPESVSPGGIGAILTAAESCPTFSWAASTALAFEITVFEIEPETPPGAVAQGGTILDVQLPAGARSWSPSAGDCLAPGGFYGWSVRAVVDGGSTGWSAARLFQVSELPAAAEVVRAQEILRSYLASLERKGDNRSAPAVGGSSGHGRPVDTSAGAESESLADAATVDVAGTVEARGVRSISGGAPTQGNIVVAGDLTTRDGVLEAVAVYLTAPGTLDRRTLLRSPAPNEVEIKSPSGIDADGELQINRVFTNTLEVGVSGTLQAGAVSIGSEAASYQGDGGAGVVYAPITGSDELRLDTAGDLCGFFDDSGSFVATGFVTAVRFKIVDTNQAGVEVRCSN